MADTGQPAPTTTAILFGVSEMEMNLIPGSTVCFLYPHANDIKVKRKRMEPRRIFVLSLRDLHERPLVEETGKLNPNVDRGRWLVTGWCFDRQAERSFYLNAMQETEAFEPMPWLRVPIIEDGEIVRIVLVSDPRSSFAKAYNAIDDSDMAVA